jgi:hypothetical protein
VSSSELRPSLPGAVAIRLGSRAPAPSIAAARAVLPSVVAAVLTETEMVTMGVSRSLMSAGLPRYPRLIWFWMTEPTIWERGRSSRPRSGRL